MKAKLFDRILLAIVLLFVLLLGLFLILLSVNIFQLSSVQETLRRILTDQTFVIIVGVSGLVLIIVALRLMFAGSGSARKKTEPQPTSTLIKASELGASFITLSAIDSMVQKHCRANNRIRSTVSTISAVKEGGVTISARLSLMPDTEIPELTEELQRSLKEYIEKYSGITVREIGILIEDTSSNPKGRVE